MAIKSGELIHVGNQVLVDRAQTAGPGSLNVPTEKIYELGNYESVATIRDIPDLSFALESLDVSTEIEAMLVGKNAATDAAGTEYDLSKSLPLDVVSAFKAGRTATNPFDVVASVAIPYLVLESASYRFGIRDNATQALSLKGDSIFYAGGSAYVQEEAGTNAADQEVVLDNTALPFNGDSSTGTRYALSVSLKSGKRLVLGADYTEAVTGVGVGKTVTLTISAPVAATDLIRVTYQSDVVAAYPQVSHAAASATRPAAVKGKDIEVRIGGLTINDRWTSIQNVSAEYRVTLERDEEMGSAQVVAQDFDVPEVSGTVDIKPRDAVELLTRIKQIAGVTGNEVVGPYTAAVLPLEILIKSPESGAVLKTLYIPDARFTLPGYSGQVQQKLTVSFPWESDGGKLLVYKGAKPA